MAPQIAAAYGGTAEVTIQETAALTYNDPALTAIAVTSLNKALGKENVKEMSAVTGARRLSAFQEKVPDFYFFGWFSSWFKPARSLPPITPQNL